MLCGVLLGIGLLIGCGGKADVMPVAPPPPSHGPKAIIKTKFGDIHIKFYPDRGPESCCEFYQVGQVWLLRRDDFPPGYPRFYDSGR